MARRASDISIQLLLGTLGGRACHPPVLSGGGVLPTKYVGVCKESQSDAPPSMPAVHADTSLQVRRNH